MDKPNVVHRLGVKGQFNMSINVWSICTSKCGMYAHLVMILFGYNYIVHVCKGYYSDDDIRALNDNGDKGRNHDAISLQQRFVESSKKYLVPK